MLDTIRRILGEARAIDRWMLYVELAVLLLIFLEFAWGSLDRYRAYRERKEYQKELIEKLAKLEQDQVDALLRFIKTGSIPPATMLSVLESSELIERDALKGWRVVSMHRNFVKKWAIKRRKHS